MDHYKRILFDLEKKVFKTEDKKLGVVKDNWLLAMMIIVPFIMFMGGVAYGIVTFSSYLKSAFGIKMALASIFGGLVLLIVLMVVINLWLAPRIYNWLYKNIEKSSIFSRCFKNPQENLSEVDR
jgi:hypothetical protein